MKPTYSAEEVAALIPGVSKNELLTLTSLILEERQHYTDYHFNYLMFIIERRAIFLDELAKNWTTFVTIN